MEPDTSRHPRFTRPTLISPSRAARFSLCLFFFDLRPSLSLSLILILPCLRPLIRRDTELIVSLVASLVELGPNNEPNNGNNVGPRRRDVLPLVLRVLIGTHRSSLSLRFASESFSRGKIAAVDEEASGDLAHCAAIIPVTRDTPGGLPDEILEETLPVGGTERALFSARGPLGWSSTRCARKGAAR